MERGGIAVAEKENVLIQNVLIQNVLIEAGDCTVTLLPEFGGKIASIRVKEQELLQAPLAPLAPRTRTMAFDASDASGWDECLPSVAACEVRTEAGAAVVPDHGDLWREPWERQGSGTEELSSIALRGECFSLPLVLERSTALTETTKGWRLRLDYTLRNTGESAVPWSWTAHPLFAVAAGDTIELPDGIRSLRLEWSAGGRLGKNGDPVAWPLARLADGGAADLSVAGTRESGVGDKLFAENLGPTENWCVLGRPSAGVRIKVSFDVDATPYLGLWICYGGWPERPGAKQMCVAMEPSTAPVDSLAEAGPWSRLLEPGRTYAWPMIVDIERIER